MITFKKALEKNYFEVTIGFLNDGANPDKKINGFTPLYIAAESGHLRIVKLLLDKRANGYIPSFEWTPMKIAVCKDHQGIVEEFLCRRYSPNQLDIHGCTPLMWAIDSLDDPQEMVSLLLRWGADPNAQDNKGCTPLMYAAIRSLESITRMLILEGARKEIKNRAGKTAGYYQLISLN